jgi:hypothetical protein
MAPRLGVLDHLAARRLPQTLVGQVVGGGPQATGGNDEVRPGGRLLQSGSDAFRVVPDGGVTVDGDAKGGEPAAQVG